MASIEVSRAAATAVVDYDMFTGVPGAEIQPGERCVGIALKGSAAAGDSRVRFMAGDTLIGWIYNNSTGAPGRDDVIPATYRNRTGSTQRLYGIVTDAPASNPLFVLAIVG
jgi:hypothetical protein